MDAFPPLVSRALALASSLRFENACSRETGRLLHALAAAGGRTRVAETGTGVGVGAAWIASSLEPTVAFFTAEVDVERAEAARDLFAEAPNVHVLTGDWHDVLPAHAPFDLLFHDGSKRRPDLDGEETVALLARGGIVVMDDLTPGRPGPDPVREFWLEHAEVAAVEVAVSPREAVILGVRR